MNHFSMALSAAGHICRMRAAFPDKAGRPVASNARDGFGVAKTDTRSDRFQPALN